MKTVRLKIATEILQGMCAGDWKFDIKDKTWDDVATERALELADKLLEKYHGYETIQQAQDNQAQLLYRRVWWFWKAPSVACKATKVAFKETI